MTNLRKLGGEEKEEHEKETRGRENKQREVMLRETAEEGEEMFNDGVISGGVVNDKMSVYKC